MSNEDIQIEDEYGRHSEILIKNKSLVNEEQVINNLLKWDGSYMGNYNGIISNKWQCEGKDYYQLTIPNIGIIYCQGICTKSLFPCIVEEIKGIFKIQKRGIHRISIDNKDYIIYYVPVDISGTLIFETALNKLEASHKLRKDKNFRLLVQKIFVFCDILSLCNSNESNIILRPGVNGNYIPININLNNTTLTKNGLLESSAPIINKTNFNKWFGEETNINLIVKEIISDSLNCVDNLSIITSTLRSKIDNIIKKYDNEYIWYSYFIIDRLSKYLLMY